MSASTHTSSFALSLLRHASLPSESFVISPFSLGTALAIVHDGARGATLKELTNLLISGGSPSDVTDLYSSFALSIPFTDGEGVVFKSANRFYVDEKISLKENYQKLVVEKYNAKVKSLKLCHKADAAGEMNTFVEEATKGVIKDVISAEEIQDDAAAILINATYMKGDWLMPFTLTEERTIFCGYNGERKMEFMKTEGYFRLNQNNDLGTLLIMPYWGYEKDDHFNFFYLMPTSNFEKIRNDITSADIDNLLTNSGEDFMRITVPRFKIASKLDVVEVLSKLGVDKMFSQEADFSKISSSSLYVSKIKHCTEIETDEMGTRAAAATLIGEAITAARRAEEEPPSIVIDRSFLFGILRNDQIVFIGQLV